MANSTIDHAHFKTGGALSGKIFIIRNIKCNHYHIDTEMHKKSDKKKFKMTPNPNTQR